LVKLFSWFLGGQRRKETGQRPVSDGDPAHDTEDGGPSVPEQAAGDPKPPQAAAGPPAPAVPTPPKRPTSLSAELLTVYHLLSSRADAAASHPLFRVPETPSTLSTELRAAFRALSGIVKTDLPEQAPPTEALAPVADHALVVEAGDIDVASTIRSIDGVRKVTREVGGVWLVEADRDIRSLVARQMVVSGGVLTMLIGRSAAGQLKVRPLARGRA
jgi:hypothetical protein